MHILTQKHLHRRTFLRGLSAAVALPYLDAMEPAGLLKQGLGLKAATGKKRLVAIETVHGAAGSNAVWIARSLATNGWQMVGLQ